jgi:hypothetical protein
LEHYSNVRRFQFPLSVVEEPYLCHLAREFNVSFSIIHANIVGSHGYLDVRLEPTREITGRIDPDSPGKLISLARHLGITVRRVGAKDFWDDLELDLEEEIRRALAHALLLGENWLNLPPRLDQRVEKILSLMKKQYLVVPDHQSLSTWLRDVVEGRSPAMCGPAIHKMWDTTVRSIDTRRLSEKGMAVAEWRDAEVERLRLEPVHY